MTAEMTEGDITRATFWIRRWKLLGGGFEVSADSVQRTITAVRIKDPRPEIEAAQDRAATALMDGLERNQKKKRHVFALVERNLDAREAKEAEQESAANDEGGYCCDKHGHIDEEPDPPGAA